MLHDVIFFLLGLGLIIAGGNYLTDGAVAIARRFHLPEMVIGLTVVAFGSSTPDLVICLTSTIAGKTQLALGDVVGANLLDVLLVVGLVAAVRPLMLSREVLRGDLPILVVSSMALFFCGDDRLFEGASADMIGRIDGLLLLSLFALFIYHTLSESRHARKSADPGASVSEPPGMKMWLAIVCVAGGLGALIVGGNWIVDGASGIALRFGLSESIVGLTVVAFGSAMPDLATSVIAAVKGRSGIAIGNVVGSCVFNVFFILGLCATIRPLDAGSISSVDFGVLAIGSIFVWLFAATPRKAPAISRIEGLLLAIVYLAYMTYIVLSALHIRAF